MREYGGAGTPPAARVDRPCPRGQAQSDAHRAWRDHDEGGRSRHPRPRDGGAHPGAPGGTGAAVPGEISDRQRERAAAFWRAGELLARKRRAPDWNRDDPETTRTPSRPPWRSCGATRPGRIGRPARRRNGPAAGVRDARRQTHVGADAPPENHPLPVKRLRACVSSQTALPACAPGQWSTGRLADAVLVTGAPRARRRRCPRRRLGAVIGA